MKDWRDKQVVIVGAARQGIALARYLAERGARVTLNDARPAEQLQAAREALADLPALAWVTGGHPLSLLDGADLLCPSGGVPLTLPLIVEAQRRSLPLSNDSQIFFETAPCPVIGITGSAGKTTTTTLTGRIGVESLKLKVEGSSELSTLNLQPSTRVWVGGNIGSPLIAQVDEMQPQDLAVMELSSFQLEIMTRSPQVAAILNITPNHLDRHVTMEAYRAAKARILAFQSSRDAAVLGRDDPGAWSLAGEVRGRLMSFGLSELPTGQEGAHLKEGMVCLRLGGEEIPVLERSLIRLRGEHNLLNVLAACAIAAVAGLPSEAMRRGVESFTGAPHRLEFVRAWGGADWYNGSIATAPERVIADIRSFDEPLVLLAGGRDKDLPWEEFAALARQRVRDLVLFGEAAGLIERAMIAASDSQGGGPTITRCEGLRQAVQAAAQLVRPGDVVLLSPGGTSFDEFRDFEERGVCFAQWVKELS